MIKARITLNNLENLTYNFPNDESLATEFNEQLGKLFNTFYSKLAPETGILIRPVTKQRLQLIKRKYRNIKHPTWKVSSLPKSTKKKKKAKKVLKVNLCPFVQYSMQRLLMCIRSDCTAFPWPIAYAWQFISWLVSKHAERIWSLYALIYRNSGNF